MSAPNLSRRIRRVLGFVHLWMGIILTLPFVVLGITGSLLVYGHDIEHLFADAPKLESGPMGTPGAIIAAALAKAPQPGMSVRALRLPDEPGEPAIVRLGAGRPQPGQSPFAGTRAIPVDPVSLQVLENVAASPQWLRMAHDIHGRFLVEGRLGREIVGWAGVAMFAMGLSGLVIWWPKAGLWRRALTVGKGAKGLRLHRELHGAVGIWSLLIFLLVTFSGIYIAFPQTLGDGIRAIFPGRDPQAANQIKVTPVPGAQPLTIDQTMAQVGQALPGTRLRSVFMPVRPDQPMRLNLDRPGGAEGAPMIVVFFDPWKGQILETLDPRDFALGETLTGWQRAIHYGLGLGPLYKFLVFLSGLIIPLFSITGVAMWLLKRRNRRRTVLPEQPALAE
jgi:uncharacterized iron-regulated membrane protein